MPGLRERNKQLTRHAIIEAALGLFEAKGFDATTMEDVAAAAEVSPRTVYRYFTTKEDLVFLGQEEENRRIAARVKTMTRTADPVDQLMSGTRDILLADVSTPDQLVRSQKLIQKTPSLRAYRGQLLVRIRELVTNMLLPPRARRTEVQRARMLAAVYLASLEVAMTNWIESGAKAKPTAELDEVEALLRRAFPSSRNGAKR